MNGLNGDGGRTHFQVTYSRNFTTLACKGETHVCGRQKCFFIKQPVIIFDYGVRGVIGCCVSKYPCTPDYWCKSCSAPSIITCLCICKFYLKHIPKDIVTLIGKIIQQRTTPETTFTFELPPLPFMPNGMSGP